MSSEGYQSIDYENPFNIFAESQSYKYQPFYDSSYNSAYAGFLYQPTETRPIHEDLNPMPVMQIKKNQQPRIKTVKQSEKHNFVKIFVCLLKNYLIKFSSRQAQIQKIYLQYVVNKLKYSIKSIKQMIMPFDNKQQQLEDQFIQQFEQAHSNSNIGVFSKFNREEKIEIINNCKLSIIKSICLDQGYQIQKMAKKNKIKDKERSEQFPSYVKRIVKNLANMKIKGKDIKSIRKDSK